MPVNLATLTVILLLSLTTATAMRQKGQPTYLWPLQISMLLYTNDSLACDYDDGL